MKINNSFGNWVVSNTRYILLDNKKSSMLLFLNVERMILIRSLLFMVQKMNLHIDPIYLPYAIILF